LLLQKILTVEVMTNSVFGLSKHSKKYLPKVPKLPLWLRFLPLRFQNQLPAPSTDPEFLTLSNSRDVLWQWGEGKGAGIDALDYIHAALSVTKSWRCSWICEHITHDGSGRNKDVISQQARSLQLIKPSLTPQALSAVLRYFLHFLSAIVIRILMLKLWNLLCW
jgi:hypothetical protein